MSDPMLGVRPDEREPDDFYPTIDARCVGHLVRTWRMARGTRFIEPCAGQGHMIIELETRGMVLESATDLILYPDRDPRIRQANVFDRWFMGRTLIITNPPFDQLEPIARHLLKSAAPVMLLTRTPQINVQRMRRLMDRRFQGIVPLPFRPYWREEKKTGARHDYCWLIWRAADAPFEHARIYI